MLPCKTPELTSCRGCFALRLAAPRHRLAAAAAPPPQLSSVGSFDDLHLSPYQSTASLSLGSFDMECSLAGGRQSGAQACARVRSGCASTRGLLKPENQDRLVLLPDLHRTLGDDEPPCSCARPSPTPSRLKQQQQRQQQQQQCEEPSSSGALRPELPYCAVFDGHSGSASAIHAARRMHTVMRDEQALLEAFRVFSGSHCWDIGKEMHVQQLWQKVFASMDDEILEASRASGLIDGTTVLAGVHTGRSLFVANAGDCRAVLARNGEALRLTVDHKPGVHSERLRIEAAGGMVKHLKGSWRVLLPNKELSEVKICATSRGFGDRDFKEHNFIVSQPQLTKIDLQPHEDTFSVFASDGLWGFVEDQDVVNHVAGVLEKFSRMSKPDLQVAAFAAAQAVVKLALDRGSVDDVSVIVHVYDWQEPPAGTA